MAVAVSPACSSSAPAPKKSGATEKDASTATDLNSSSARNSSTESVTDTDTDTATDTSMEDDQAASPASPSPATTGGAGVKLAGLRASYADCTGQNKAWLASVNNAGPGCGDPLAAWCCSKDEILRRFPSVASGLQGKFSEYSDHTLYHCSETPGHIVLHFAKIDAKVSYKHVSIDGVTQKQGGAAGACTKVSIDALLAQAVDAGTADATSTDTGTSKTP